MDTWHGHTPDGRELVVHRERDHWTVRCGAEEAENSILDVALIGAIRADSNRLAHSHEIDYAVWTRELADQIERG